MHAHVQAVVVVVDERQEGVNEDGAQRADGFLNVLREGRGGGGGEENGRNRKVSEMSQVQRDAGSGKGVQQ